MLVLNNELLTMPRITSSLGQLHFKRISNLCNAFYCSLFYKLLFKVWCSYELMHIYENWKLHMHGSPSNRWWQISNLIYWSVSNKWVWLPRILSLKCESNEQGRYGNNVVVLNHQGTMAIFRTPHNINPSRPLPELIGSSTTISFSILVVAIQPARSSAAGLHIWNRC